MKSPIKRGNSRPYTRRRIKASTQLVQIAKKAQLDRKVRFTSLTHLLTPEFLKETWKTINRHGQVESTGRASSSLKASWNNG